jgi:hypothetical protein
MVTNPVGCRLSDLPFKDANDWSRLHRFLGQICDAPHQHDHTRTFMLHLAAQNRHVLFEMTATLIHGTDIEPLVVLTGRQVDANLAGLLMARENTAAESSSTNEDSGPGESVSQSGSIYGDDADNYASDVSSLTTTTLNPPSSARDTASASDHRPFALRSADGESTPTSSNSWASAKSGSIGLSRQRIPAARSGMTTPQSWDNNSLLSDLARICPIRTPGELRARPSLNAFIDNVRVARKQSLRTARQTQAYHNALTKLFTLGCFLRFARERASLRVLFVEGPAVVPHLAIPNAARRVVAEFMWVGGQRAPAPAGGFSAR